jgi:toxin ParE1/3/4
LIEGEESGEPQPFDSEAFLARMHAKYDCQTWQLSPTTFRRRATQDLEGIWFYTFDNWSRAQADRYHHEPWWPRSPSLASGARKGQDGHSATGSDETPLRLARHLVSRPSGDRLEIIRVLHSAQDTERHLHD